MPSSPGRPRSRVRRCCTSAGVPSAILRPNSIATTLSEIPITIDMWCSTSRTVRSNWSRIATMVSPSSSTSPWVRPLAGSSISRNVGLGGERPGDLEPLERAERQPGGRAEHQRSEAELRRAGRRRSRGSRLFSLAAPIRSDRPAEADLALAVGADHHVLEQRHRREQRQVLERPGDAQLGDAVGRDRRAGRWPRNEHRPVGRLVDAADDVEHRRLAGTVRPDQAADLALVDREGQAVERHDATEADRDLLYVEQTHSPQPPLCRA